MFMHGCKIAWNWTVHSRGRVVALIPPWHDRSLPDLPVELPRPLSMHRKVLKTGFSCLIHGATLVSGQQPDRFSGTSFCYLFSSLSVSRPVKADRLGSSMFTFALLQSVHDCNIGGLIFFEMFVIFYSREVIPWLDGKRLMILCSSRL